MTENLEELKEKARQLETQMDKSREMIETIGGKLGVSKNEIESLLNGSGSDTPIHIDTIEMGSNPKPVFSTPDDINTGTPSLEKMRHDTDNENEPVAYTESKKSLAELEAELEKARLNYFKKVTEQNKIKIISKALLHKITDGKFKPDFVQAKNFYETIKKEYVDTKYSKKSEDLEKDIFKNKEEKERELADFKAHILEEESSRIWDLEDARAEALSERRKALREKALKITLSPVKVVGAGLQAVQKVDKKIFHRGPILIDKRGKKPVNADNLISQADTKLNEAERLQIAVKKETDKEIKEDMLDEIKQLKEDAEKLKDQAKGEIIYQYRLGQLVRTTALFATGGGFVSGGAGVAMLGLKIARSVGIGVGGAYALARNEKVLKTKLSEIEIAKEKIHADREAGNINDNDAFKAERKLNKQERLTKIKGNAMKVVIVGLMASANYASGHAEKGIYNYFNNADSTESLVPSAHKDALSPNENTPVSDTQEPLTEKEAISSEPKIVEGKVLFSTEVSSQGSIATLENLKGQLANQYQGVPSDQIPANVQHILNTNSTQLAKDWGMFNANEAKESAMMLKGSTITVDENGNITLHNLGKGETVLSGEGAQTYTGEMFDSDHQAINGGVTKLGEGEVNINEIPEDGEGYTKLTDGGVDINQSPDGLGADSAPYADGMPADQSDLDKVVWEKSGIHIRGNAYEDASGNIVRLDGKEITLGADHKIYVDGVVSEHLTKELSFEKSKILDSTFTRNFAWTRDGAKSPEWIRLQNYNMETLKNPPTDGFLNDKETKFISKLLKVAKRNGVDYHGKTANQLVEAIAINKLG